MKTTKLFLIPLLLLFLIGFSSCDEDNSPEPDNDSMMDMKDDSNDGDMDDNDDGNNDGGNNNANQAPDFSLKSLNDETVKLSDYKGKVVVLFFFGNSCPSCKAIAPDIQSKIANSYSSDKVVVLGIDQWNGTKSSVQGFKNSTGVSFTLLLNGSSVASDYSTTYDRLIVVDKEGNIQFKGTRVANSDLNSAKETVDKFI